MASVERAQLAHARQHQMPDDFGARRAAGDARAAGKLPDVRFQPISEAIEKLLAWSGLVLDIGQAFDATVLLVASRSCASAVRPTTVPTGSSSRTLFARPSTSATALTPYSLTSCTAMVSASVVALPSLETARTTIVWLCAVSASSRPATVTTPVLALMSKLPASVPVKL